MRDEHWRGVPGQAHRGGGQHELPGALLCAGPGQARGSRAGRGRLGAPGSSWSAVARRVPKLCQALLEIPERRALVRATWRLRMCNLLELGCLGRSCSVSPSPVAAFSRIGPFKRSSTAFPGAIRLSSPALHSVLA